MLSSRFVFAAILTAIVLSMCACPRQCAAYTNGDPEFRAFWVDAFHDGFLTQGQVDQLLGVVGDPNSKGDLRNANCNAVFIQGRRRADTCYKSNMGEPFFTSFDALKAVIAAAHDTTGGKQRIEVHCWMVAFATATSTYTSPVFGSHSNPADPDNYWVSLDDSGNFTGDKAFDPGHPKCLKYLSDVVMDVINNYDVDGVHYDYIRFTANNQGYNPTSVARYNARYGTINNPSAGDERFKQWRRDQVSALVRQVYARIQATKPSVLQSGSFVTWNSSPISSDRAGFQATRPYYDVYSDWDSWLQEGIVDMGVPMTYYDLGGSYPGDWTRWINFEKDRHGNRQMIIGPGVYMNSLSNSIAEVLQTRDASPAGNHADGFSGYSYACPFTYGGTNYGSWSSYSPTFVSQVCPTTAPIPVRPWKSAPTKGHISGTVTYSDTGAWADGATISIIGPESRTQICDGTGFYAFIDLTPGVYTVTASKSGYPNTVRTVSVAIGSVTGNMYVTDIRLGGTNPPSIYNVQSSGVDATNATITWDTDQNATTRVEYGPTNAYGSTSPLDGNLVLSHTVTLAGLTPDSTYHYRVISGSGNGDSTSTDYTFTTPILGNPPVIDPASVHVTNITSSSATISWTTDIPSTSQAQWGSNIAYGNQTAIDTNLVTSHVVQLTGLSPSWLYHFDVLSKSAGGALGASGDYSFVTGAPPPDTIVDDADPGAVFSGTAAWTTGTYPGGYNNTYKWVANRNTSSTASCTWTPNLSRTGTYDVYVWYTSGSNRTANATFKINYSGGSVSKSFDERSNGSQWLSAASGVRFLAGTSGNVVLTNVTGESNTANKAVTADAIKFVFVGGDGLPPTIPQNVSASPISATSMAVYWSASVDDTAVTGYKVYRNSAYAGSSTTTSFTDTGLSPNTLYTYTVSAFDAIPNESQTSSSAGRYTLSVPLTTSTVTCNKTVGAWYSTSDFRFQSPGFGAGKATAYKCVWDGSPTHIWNETEEAWATTFRTLTATSTTQPWYFHAKGYNAEGLANGTIDLGPYNYGAVFSTIASAMSNPDGAGVIIDPHKQITAVFGDSFYVQEADRTRALRVDSTTALAVGKKVTLGGRLAGSSGVRSLVGGDVIDVQDGTIAKPMFTRISALGGGGLGSYTSGLPDANGLYNVGLLVRVVGKVISHTTGSFVVDDGSGATAKVYSDKAVSDASTVGVTGICSLEDTQRIIRARTTDDVQTYAGP